MQEGNVMHNEYMVHAIEGVMVSTKNGILKLLDLFKKGKESHQIFVISPVTDNELSLTGLLERAENKDERLWAVIERSRNSWLELSENSLESDVTSFVTDAINASFAKVEDILKAVWLLEKSSEQSRIYLESKLGYKALDKLFISAEYSFKSQFSNTYEYPTPSAKADGSPLGENEEYGTADWNKARNLKSGFFSPANMTLGLGLDYNPFNWLTVNLAPLTGGIVFVDDPRLRESYSMPLVDKSSTAPDQASNSLAEHQNRIRNRIFLERSSSRGSDPVTAGLDQRVIWHGKRQFGDDHIAECVARNIHTGPETLCAEDNTVAALPELIEHRRPGKGISMDQQLIACASENWSKSIGTVTQHSVVGKKHERMPPGKIDKVTDCLHRRIIIVCFARQRHRARKIQFHLSPEIKRRVQNQISSVAETDTPLKIIQVSVYSECRTGQNNWKCLCKQRTFQNIRDIQRCRIKFNNVVSREGTSFLFRPVDIFRLPLRNEVGNGITHGEASVDLSAKFGFELLVFLFVGIVPEHFFQFFE